MTSEADRRDRPSRGRSGSSASATHRAAHREHLGVAVHQPLHAGAHRVTPAPSSACAQRDAEARGPRPRRRAPSARPARCRPPRHRPVPATARAWSGVEMPKPTATGSGVAAADPRDRRRAVLGQRGGRARSRPGGRPDRRSPALPRPRPRGGRDAWSGATSRMRSSGLVLRPPTSTAGSLPAGRSVSSRPGDAERLGVGEEAVEPVPQNGIEVAEDDHRAPSSRPLDQRQRAGEGHALAKRVEGGALDGGPVGQRIAERDADLEDVRDLVRRAERRRGSSRRTDSRR